MARIASAHGGPPEALALVSSESEEPNVVLLNEGLAYRAQDGWTYLCPRLWGDTDISTGKAPLAHSIDGITSFVIGADDLYALRDGSLEARMQPALSRASVIELVATRDALFALRIAEGGGAEIMRVDEAGEPIFRSAEAWSALAVDDDRFYLARSSGEVELDVLIVDVHGAIVETRHATLPTPISQVRLRPSAEQLFAVVFDGAQYTLGTVLAESFESRAQSITTIQGPQASASGQLWVAIDGQLRRASADGVVEEQSVEAPTITCLERWGTRAYACSGSSIHALDDEGLGAQLFRLDGLAAQAPAAVPEAARAECAIQWSVYRYDLERVGLMPREPSAGVSDAGVSDAGVSDAGLSDAGVSGPTPRPRSSSCSAAPRGDSAWLFALVLYALVRRARRVSAANLVKGWGPMGFAQRAGAPGPRSPDT